MLSPGRFRFPFLAIFIFNNMAGFVFGFVFSTATCFQQLLGFVFGFVWVRFLARWCIINNFSGSFFKITSFCCPICLICPKKARVAATPRHFGKTIILADNSQANSAKW